MKPGPLRSLLPAGLLLAVLLVQSLLLYAPSAEVPFLHDDLVAGALLAPEGRIEPGRVARAMLPVDPPFHFRDHWRPLGWLSLSLDLALFGFRPEALRRVALLCHAANALLVALLVRRLAALRGPALPASAAALGGALFVAWPGGPEPVVWIAHRFTLLVTLGLLATALAVLRHVERGRGHAVILAAALVALGAKDSALTELAAPAALGLAVARPGEERRRAAAAAVHLGGLVLLSLLARRLLFGRFLPAAGEAGSEMGSIPGALRALPGTLRDLFAPLVEGGGLPGGRLVPLAGVLAVLLGLRRASWPLLRPALVLPGALLLAGLPTLQLGPDLDGSRRLYAAAAGVAVVAALAARHPLLLVLGVLSWSWTLRANQVGYVESGHLVEALRARVEDPALREPIFLVDGLGPGGAPGMPATHRGAPCYGPGGSHLPLLFLPPNAQRRREVRTLRAEEAWARIEEPGVGTLLVVSRIRSPSPELTALRLPLAGSPPAEALERPAPGAIWPGDDPALRLGAEARTLRSTHAILVSARVEAKTARWLRPVPDAVMAGLPRWELGLADPWDLLPPHGLQVLLAQAPPGGMHCGLEALALDGHGVVRARFAGGVEWRP